MAAHYFGVSLGGSLNVNVTQSTSTTSKQYEFVIANTTASGANKEQALRALSAIVDKISEFKYPPA